MSTVHNNRKLKSFRRELRQKQTRIEGLVWKSVKNKQLGYKSKRQHSIGPYIIDFYCAEAKLVVELDGSFHQEQIEQDKKRTAYLESLHLHVIRYTSYQVLEQLEDVITDIQRICTNRTTSPSPSSTDEGNVQSS